MQITNKYNLPQAIVNAVKGFNYMYKTGRKETDISVTELIAPPLVRKLRLENEDKLTEDVSDRIWVLLGSAIHRVLEHSAQSDVLTEERLYSEIDGHKLSGQADFFDPSQALLQDYKITSAWSVLDGYKLEWEQQLNVLAHLYRCAGFQVDKLQVVAILRDFSKSKAGDGRYPEIPVKVIDVPIWSYGACINYIKDRIEVHFSTTIAECSAEEKWTTEAVYALMKKGRKSAVKLYASQEEADKACETREHCVEVRPGRNVKCEEYCVVRGVCPYAKH